MREPTRLSPLAHRTPIIAGAVVGLQEHAFVGKLILRGAAETIAHGVATATGLYLPTVPCRYSSAGEITGLWLGPDEWLILTPVDRERSIAEDLRSGLTGKHHQVADVTDYYTLLEVSGIKARELLMKLTTLDVHPRAFKPGDVRGTNLGHAQSTIYLRDAGDDGSVQFWLTVRWSMADYLWCLLAHAGLEWGLPEQHPISGEPMDITATA